MMHRLSSFSDYSVEVRDDAYYGHKIDAARSELLRGDLRVNSDTGYMREGSDWIERPAGPSEWTDTDRQYYRNRDAVWEGFFAREIRARAARLSNLEGC